MIFRWLIIGIALLASVFTLIAPPKDTEASGRGWSMDDIKLNVRDNINLGLDLQGGIFMQLEVDAEDAVEQFMEEQAGTIKAILEGDGFKIGSSQADIEKNTITLTGVTSEEYDDIEKEIKRRHRGYWDIRKNGDNFILTLKANAKQQTIDNAVDQTVYKIQNRIDSLGVTEPVINRMVGSNRIVLELPGADDVTRVHKIVEEPGKLEWRMVKKGSPLGAATQAELLTPFGGQVPAGFKVFPHIDDKTGRTTYLLLDSILLTASNISDVYPSSDDRGLPAVGITLDAEGGRIFAETTKVNVGNQLAVVLDDKVLTYPTIQGPLAFRFIITGSFNNQEVQDMVVKIKSGSLPADVDILETRSIGPTLGRDAIKQGSMAAVIGLVLVIIFIAFYYKRAGIYAIFALVLNMIFILGMLAGMGAVLTLPGIAGFILTIGMAVDANVLVFERIREELRAGTPPKKAVEVGYKTAFVTILDANITTFLAAFCLLLMGEGPIKGFAIMLMIGIVSSIFTAVFCSRTFFMGYLNGKATLAKLSI